MFFTKKTGEQVFWDWFLKNESMLYDFEDDLERVFDRLSEALKHVAPELTFEFSPKQKGVREFIISAGGIKSAFPFVESLAAAAPRLQRWRVIKYRPRRNPLNELNYGSKTVKPEDVEFCILSNGQELGLYIFFKNYTKLEQDTWEEMGYLLLDEALGEYDVEMKVGIIEFFSFEEHTNAKRYPLTRLAEIFDSNFAKLVQ